MYMHHTVMSQHAVTHEHEVLVASRSIATEQQLQQVQRLYDETQVLLKRALASTGNASHAASIVLQHSMDRIRGTRVTQPGHSGGSSAEATASALKSAQEVIERQSGEIAQLKKILAEEKFLREKLKPPEFGASSSSSSLSSTAAPKWLVIGMPTVSRLKEEDYLLHTLDTVAQQLPRDPQDLMYMRVAVIVVNVQAPGTTHRRFLEAQARYAPGAHPMAACFTFLSLDASEQYPDPKRGATAENDLGNANVPGFRVRKQTRNLAAVMQRAYSLFPEGAGGYYMFLEDDMQLCRHGLVAAQYLLAKASRYHPNWLAIRASYGMNGIFLHMKDVPTFGAYLLKHQLRRPPDHLVVEWFAGETPEAKAYRGNRANVGFRHNLFDHIGVYSSLRSEIQTSFPRCYELLAEPTVFKVEAFDPLQCPRDDIWPCRGVLGVGMPDATRLRFEGLGPSAS